MNNVTAVVDGLTFVSHGTQGQVTVWSGAPGESDLLGTAIIGGFVVTEEGPVPMLDALDEGILIAFAQEYLQDNPHLRPLTDDQKVALESLDEVIRDTVGDADIMGRRAVALNASEAVEGLVKSAIETLVVTIAEHVGHGDHPKVASTAGLVEALHGTFTAGFAAGQAFQQRGYRL